MAPEFDKIVIPWEFPLTEEDTIKMENRYAVLLMAQQREKELYEERKAQDKKYRKQAAKESKTAIDEPDILNRYNFYK